MLLVNSSGDRGVSLHFKKSQLPCFTLWKCTQPEQSGYVTGLEPGTNYPNFKAFERHHGRVISLEAGQSHTTEIRVEAHITAEEVQSIRERIQDLQGDQTPQVHQHPSGPYCPVD